RTKSGRKDNSSVYATEVTGITTTQLNGTTYMSTAHEMSIPGYLLVQVNVDYSIGKQIAKGGGGAISHCEIHNTQLDERCGHQNLIVKAVGEHIDQLTVKMKDSFFQELSMMWRFRDDQHFAKVYG